MKYPFLRDAVGNGYVSAIILKHPTITPLLCPPPPPSHQTSYYAHLIFIATDYENILLQVIVHREVMYTFGCHALFICTESYQY